MTKRLLEDLAVGTPVLLENRQVGDVRGVYAEGESQLAEFLAVHWTERNQTVLIPTKHVASLDENGVLLMGNESGVDSYANLATFEEARMPTLRKLVP